MKNQLRYITILLAMIVGYSAVAQSVPPKVVAAITPDSILIGDRFTLTIDVEKDQVQAIYFPAFGSNEEAEGEKPKFGVIECIEDHPADTLEHRGRKVLLRKRYTMTAFDEGIYNIGRPSVLYADKNIVDTLYGCDDSLRVFVSTFAMDSTAMLRDIKPVKTLSFRFGEIAGYLIAALVVLALLGLGVWILSRYLAKRGRSIADLFKPEPPLPAHIVAIAALEKLQDQKLWQNNRHKEYYSGLSDILRTYLDGRFGIGAMEMTTDEIVEAIKGVELSTKCAMDLTSVLRDADLVKFAKAMFEAAENESAYSRAYYFVEETKVVEQAENEEEQ